MTTHDVATPTTQKLFAALVEAQKHAKAVEKDSTNQYHRYRYASAEAVIAEAREALNAAGLAVMTTTWSFCPEVAADVESRPKASIGRIRVEYMLVHVSGEHFLFVTSSPVVLEKGRPEDKAEAGSLTQNLAYFLRGLLLLPREDEVSAIDARDDRSYSPTNREQTSAASSTPEAKPRDDRWNASQERAPGAEEARTSSTDSKSPDIDPAHEALAKEFERRIGEMTEIQALSDFASQIKGAKIPEQLLARVRKVFNARRAELAGAAPNQFAAAS